MSIVKEPYVSITKQSAGLGVGLDDQKILVIGQKLSTGTAIEKTLDTNVSESEVDDLYGAGSALAYTLKAMFAEFEYAPSPNLPRIDVISLEDSGTATKASKILTLSASGGVASTKTGTVTCNLMDKEFDIDITIGDEYDTDIAPAIVASVNLLGLPVTASDDGSGVVTIEMNNGGTIFNNSTIRLSGLQKVSSDYFLGNIQFALTESAGTNDPTVTSLLDVADKIRYQSMTYPVEYGTDLATDFLDPRFNVANAIKDGICIVKNTDSKADLLVTLGLLNSNSLIYFCNKEVDEDLFKGGEDLDLDFVSSARVCAVRALRLTEDANIVNFTPANVQGSLDSFGGMHIASLPYFNTPLFGSPIQPEGRGWTDTEAEELKKAGGSVLGNNIAGNRVILGEVLTTYKTDTAGNEDTTWKYANTVDTMSVCAEYIFNNLKADYIQSRLTVGDVVRGYSMVNEKEFISTLQKYYLYLAGKALVPNSKTSVNYFINNLSVAISTVLGRITATGNLPIVVQLREILATLKTDFGTQI
jgi:phage tail sheath gpL-like